MSQEKAAREKQDNALSLPFFLLSLKDDNSPGYALDLLSTYEATVMADISSKCMEGQIWVEGCSSTETLPSFQLTLQEQQLGIFLSPQIG